MSEDLFETLIDRNNSGAVKWDNLLQIYGDKELLPMWVADMDFPSPAAVQEALMNRVKHPLYGYTGTAPSVYTAIQDWIKYRHQWEVRKNWITFSPGVVTALSTVIQACTEPGDKILLQSPVYTPFFDLIKSNERVVVNSQLTIENGRFEIDFIDLEAKLKNGVKLFLLCSPHNPGGRVWTEEELTKIGDLCAAHGVTIVSDEIHADLYIEPAKHRPLAALDQRYANITITCMAPSKTFNIAGLQASILITSNTELQDKISLVNRRNGFHGLNLIGLTAMEAAYKDGAEWLENLMTYIKKNVEIAIDFINKEIPGVSPMYPNASYLLWLDCRQLGLTDEELRTRLIKEGRLALEPGPKYGPGGEGFVRMNIGCPRSILMDGLERLKKAFA
ncbi:pyridoxal phosphate-dependent aminotransferase [Peribacillus saganii]|uniref:cysteine-S-conjugate beta-lyase n=1 Tax=Peribacillus saganii TaxID=2303992 RepID=A0A372LPW6_9BACI|nr:MalY/PatB family protein [Peribacillus saganii]RFU70164.1 pyridoxal phosphate-dependent aminotransferase [Peribacillus saganii]